MVLSLKLPKKFKLIPNYGTTKESAIKILEDNKFIPGEDLDNVY